MTNLWLAHKKSIQIMNPQTWEGLVSSSDVTVLSV